ncbi:hypothetical protein VKT23_001337 [Stygiomarasmius scandens]|uniref:Uncharacterized protein n=1 Tax=Marasmiellus scandens TaxID=2682957 RepID=A0ABR1K9E9_9AGAR
MWWFTCKKSPASEKSYSSGGSLVQPIQVPVDEIIYGYCKKAKTDVQFLGHSSALRGKIWTGSESGRSILVDNKQPDEPAVFWVIGRISHEDFWLYPDGGLHGNLKTKLTSHHATAFLTRPSDKALGDLFDAALAIAPLSESVDRNSAVITKDHLVRIKFDERYLRIKHRILEIPESDGDVESELEKTTNEKEKIVAEKWKEFDDRWTLETLPCRTEYSLDERNKLIRNNNYGYKWNLLPAYNVQGLPIAPNQYESMLRGATVLCHISLCRWEIEKKYSFSPHIVQLRVLIPPSNLPHTPRKQKRFPMDP